ncbi:MAG: hypothetical protein J4G11_10820 [Acidimicrobiia bacterium]|nr:hypothetical protein [Acidimicrobiia bacterium]
MTIVDLAGAAEQVNEFWGLLVDYEHSWTAARDMKREWDQSDQKRRRRLAYAAIGQEKTKARFLRRDLLRLQALIEEIAKHLDPTLDYRDALADVDSEEGIRRARKASERLVGRIQDHPERERIFGPVGPVLNADGLHAWVWNAARDLWDGGHYKEAVHAAATAVERQTSLKIETDRHGASLYSQAFRVSEKSQTHLRFPDIKPGTKRWTSAHEGAMYFGMGCSMGIRNETAHTTEPIDEQIGLEYLAAFSVLARWVETAEVS